MSAVYDSDFFEKSKESRYSSARAVAPYVMDLVSPSSVIDIGCGTGVWLNVFRASGVDHIHGVDGDYVESLEISRKCFEVHDLETPYSNDDKFDLAMSLEVAEHLSEESASILVESLVNLAPVVLFSAAIPAQPGLNHVNCNWPAYWANLFKTHGYYAVDCLRPVLWGNPAVSWWYRQNIMYFVKGDHLDEFPDHSLPLPLVHPELFKIWVEHGIKVSGQSGNRNQIGGGKPTT